MPQSRCSSADIKVFFSRRGGTDYHTMRDYLCLLRDGREMIPPRRTIDWDLLNPETIQVENHSKRAAVQIADVFTSATFAAFEPNRYGNCESRYGRLLSNRYIRLNGRILDAGITLIPSISKNPLTGEQHGFISMVEKGNGRPPVP